MKPQSAKAKGRKAAAEVRDLLLSAFPQLEPDDIHVTPSGVNGEDLQFSPRARSILPYAIEVKNQERLNIWSALDQTNSHIKGKDHKPLVVFRRNRIPLHVCMEFTAFLELLVG